MKLVRLKDIIGFSLVGLHLIAIGLCFLWLRGRMSLQSFQITVLILSPVTAIYALAYARETAKSMLLTQLPKSDNKIVTVRFAALAFIFTASFSIGVIYTIYSYAFENNTQTADDLKLSLSILETALGGFMGLIVETLFGKLETESAT